MTDPVSISFTNDECERIVMVLQRHALNLKEMADSVKSGWEQTAVGAEALLAISLTQNFYDRLADRIEDSDRLEAFKN